MMNVRLSWPPTVNTYYTVARNRKILSTRGRQFKKNALKELATQMRPTRFDDTLEVLIDAYPPDRRKRDIDNIVKPILDVLQDFGLFDDSQVDDLRVRRLDVQKPGFVRIKINRCGW